MCLYPQIGQRKFESKSNKFRILPLAFYKDLYSVSPGSEYVIIPCGKCIECKQARKNAWTYRAMLELEKFNGCGAMLTLTYNDEFNPEIVQSKQLQDFLKRLRKAIKKESGKKIKFIACSEYGKLHDRPHYHLAIFGYDFPDKTFFKLDNGNAVFRSELLEKCWKFGFSSVCEINERTIAYVVKYIQKYNFGKDYLAQGLLPPFFRCSKGIGKDIFLSKHIINDTDFVSGREYNIPRYLLSQLDNYDELKEKRVRQAKRQLKDIEGTFKKINERIHTINRNNRINRK